MVEEAMTQPYLSKSPAGTGYLFRRGVPADVREQIGKREFKETLGGDFQSASQRCRELAVETDRQIRDARIALAGNAPPKEAAPGNHAAEPSLIAIKTVTPDLVERLRTSVVEQVLDGDKALRQRSHQAVDADAKTEQIERIRAWAQLAWQGDEIAIRGWSDMLAGTLKRNGVQLGDELKGSSQERELLVEYAAAYRDALDALKATYSGARRSSAPTGKRWTAFRPFARCR